MYVIRTNKKTNFLYLCFFSDQPQISRSCSTNSTKHISRTKPTSDLIHLRINMVDYYKTLDVSKAASDAEIKKAYVLILYLLCAVNLYFNNCFFLFQQIPEVGIEMASRQKSRQTRGGKSTVQRNLRGVRSPIRW